MLASASREYNQQQRLAALAVIDAERIATRGSVQVARSVQVYQAAAVALSMQALDSVLGEQGISTEAEAAIVPASLVTDTPSIAGMLDATTSPQAFTRLVSTLVQDANRTARAVDSYTRPAVTGYVRSLTPPSCSRCAILAGRVYRYSTGFQRHPHCDCLMTPTTEALGKDLVTDPTDLLEKGQVTGLSKGDVEAVNNGADLGQVVNVRRKQAGLTVGSSVMVRSGRLTPQGCLMFGSDRADSMRLLRRYGYIT